MKTFTVTAVRTHDSLEEAQFEVRAPSQSAATRKAERLLDQDKLELDWENIDHYTSMANLIVVEKEEDE